MESAGMMPPKLAATTTVEAATSRDWPVVVIGAGPAGSFLARGLARAGVEVLLVDRSEFPRWKVCGCCLNGAALAVLDAAGQGQLVARCGGVRLDRISLAAGSGAVDLRLPGGAALSRESFDTALIESAIEEGVSFLPGTFARLARETASQRLVTLASATKGESTVAARVVIAADGLAGLSLNREPGSRSRTRRHSRIGAGAVATNASEWFQRGTIYMACGAGGYVGAVRLEDGRLDLAAALDPDQVRQHGGLPNAVASIVRARGWPDVAGSLSWRGTPLLTRQPIIPAGARYFMVGDAAGYVEPFTGEGIAWALASAVALTPLVEQAVVSWKPGLIHEWSRRLHRLLVHRRLLCRMLTGCLRSPFLSSAMVRLLRLAPFLARPFIAGLNRPLRVTGSTS
jgi:flavin-dependent dehydrogenase